MNYFAYGSNMDPRVMVDTIPDASALGPGRLEGFRLAFNVYSERWQGGAANLEPDEGAYVWGVVWKMSESDVPKLDTYAGHPTFYRQDHVQVELGRVPTTCLTYRVAHQQGYVRPTDSYVNRVLSAMRQQGLPPEALDMFERAARPPFPHIDS